VVTENGFSAQIKTKQKWPSTPFPTSMSPRVLLGTAEVLLLDRQLQLWAAQLCIHGVAKACAVCTTARHGWQCISIASLSNVDKDLSNQLSCSTDGSTALVPVRATDRRSWSAALHNSCSVASALDRILLYSSKINSRIYFLPTG
jgi:hypothetical protein